MTRSPLGDARHLRLIFVYNRAFVRRICSTKVVLYLLRVTNVPQSTTPLLQVAQHLDWVCENECFLLHISGYISGCYIKCFEKLRRASPVSHRKTRPAGYTFAVFEEFNLCQTAWGLKKCGPHLDF